MAVPRGCQHGHPRADPHRRAAAQPYSPLDGMAEVHDADWWLGDRLAACTLCAAAETATKACRDPSRLFSMSPTPERPHCSPPRGAWLDRGQTIVFDCVSTVGRIDQVPALAHELVSRRPDVLMALQWSFVRALKQETTIVPIVMLSGWEPVRIISGFAGED